jgi:hypothetical protein
MNQIGGLRIPAIGCSIWSFARTTAASGSGMRRKVRTPHIFIYIYKIRACRKIVIVLVLLLHPCEGMFSPSLLGNLFMYRLPIIGARNERGVALS